MLTALLDIFYPRTVTGVRCALCGWTWRDPNVHNAFGTVDKQRADRLFAMHVADRHPQLVKP